MAIERKYTITCDQCGHQADEDFDDDWYDLFHSARNSEGRYEPEEFHLCSDECAAAFDPREHRSYT